MQDGQTDGCISRKSPGMSLSRNKSFPDCRKSLPVQDPSKREAGVQPQDMLNQNDFHAFSSFYPETEGLCFLTEAQRFTNQAP